MFYNFIYSTHKWTIQKIASENYQCVGSLLRKFGNQFLIHWLITHPAINHHLKHSKTRISQPLTLVLRFNLDVSKQSFSLDTFLGIFSTNNCKNLRPVISVHNLWLVSNSYLMIEWKIKYPFRRCFWSHFQMVCSLEPS